MKFRFVYRITTYVPPDHLQRLVAGIVKIDPIAFGRYDQVFWWSAPGTEQFRARPGAKYYHEGKDMPTQKSSVQLQFSISCNQALLKKILQEGIVDNHPWEEPVIYVDKSIATVCTQ